MLVITSGMTRYTIRVTISKRHIIEINTENLRTLLLAFFLCSSGVSFLRWKRKGFEGVLFFLSSWIRILG